MAVLSFEEYKKQMQEGKKPESLYVSKPTVTSGADTESTSVEPVNAAGPAKSGVKTWTKGGSTYVTDRSTGKTTQTFSALDYFLGLGSQGEELRKMTRLADQQAAKEKGIKPSHESLSLDLGQMYRGTVENIGAAYSSAVATLANTAGAIAAGDNNYEPEEDSFIWKLVESAEGKTGYAERNLENAKEGRGAVGRFAMDVGSAGLELAVDQALNFIVPGSGLAAMGVRSFGRKSEASREAGESVSTQVIKGSIAAATAVATERMSEIGGLKTGKPGYLDRAWDKVTNVMESKTGSKILGRVVTGFGSEALEEVIESITNPIAQRAFGAFGLLGEDEADAFESIGQIAYEGLVGGTLGALGAVGNVEYNGAKESGETAAPNITAEELARSCENATNLAIDQHIAKAEAKANEQAEITQPMAQADGTTSGGNPSVSLRSTAPLTQGSQSAQTDLQTAAVTQETQTQAAEAADRLPKAELYNMRAGKNGWDKTYGTAQEALGEAVQYVDAELWNAIGKEIDNAEGNKQGFTPMTSAMIAVQEEVRQEQITPMQGAKLLSEIYQQGGAEALKTIYNPRTGNLYDKYIGQAKQYVFQKAAETAQNAQRATPQAETPPTTQNDVTDALNALNLFEEGNVASADYDTQSRESLMFSEAPQEAVQNTDSFGAVTANDDFQNRDFNKVGNQKIKAYMYENPEVKPFFQLEAEAMLNDLKNSVKGERFYNSQLAYESGNEYGWTGNKRFVSDDIAVLLDYGYSYEEIEKGLKAIIEDDGRENNACSKRIEFLLNDRLMDGYTDWQSNEFVPPNQEYRNMILEKQINAYSKEAFEEYLKNAERYAPKEAKINSNGQLNRRAETMAREQGAGVQREARETEGADTVRGFSKNVATDSAMETALREDIAKNPDLYKRLSNKDTLKKAQDIFSQGLDTARSELERAIGAAQSGQKLSPEMVPLSRMVANELTRRGELEAARKIISDVAAELTSAGQLGQAGAILRNADPMTVLNTLQRAIDQINAEMAKKFGKRNPWTAELTAEEIKQISETDFSQDGAFEAVQHQIAVRLGREMPATLLEKLRELRKVGMLANPKTQIKNVAGNMPLAGERKIAEKLSGGLQELAVKAGIMSKEEQTRTLRVSKESKDLAKSVYENNIDRINRKGNKGELRGLLKDTRTYFNKGLLQKGIEKATGHQLDDAALDYVRRFTYDCLEKGDAPFVKSAFIDSLAQYCEAQGIKSEADVTETAISYAIDQAMAATFKDASALANLLNGIKDKAGVAGQALDVLLPFTTTPINIAKEFGKYSPLGYLQLLNAKGKGTAEVIDIISRATTGSAVVAIGAILRSLGFITGAADDDKDKAAADKAAGISPYSFGGKYSYEWMQPTGSALAMGASIYDAAKDGGSLIETISNGIISAGDAYLEQSFYKDIIDLFQGYGSPTENMLKEVLTGTASQFIPTIVGATARTIDPTVRTSYSGGNIIDDILAQAKVKTPGLSKSAPASVNVRGEEIQRGNLLERILDNFIFPWTTNRNGGEENAVDEAINEVYADTADKTIFRQVSPYKVDYGGETYKMTGEEREQFQKTQGQVHDDILQQIIDGTLWQEMDNDAKVKTMQLANEYALDAAKRELVESRGDEYSSDWDDEAELSDVGNYLAAKTTLKAAQDSKDYTLLDALVDTVTEQQKAVQEKLNKDFSTLDELIYGKQHGVDAETIYTAKTEADANGNGKISQEELWYYLGLQKNMPARTKSVLWDILTTGKTGYSEYAEKQK